MTSPSHPRLLLFDIDGTLIVSGGAGEQALRDACQLAFGAPFDLRGIEIAGRTDAAIARNVLEALAQPVSSENIARFLDTYLANLKARLPERPGRVLPGILPLLTTLQGREGVTLGLLTGNLLRGAELKLEHYRLWHFFEFGAFADDHHERNQLGPVAMERARTARGHPFEPANIFIVGDTPHDIACARAIGAVAVAVATGGYTREDLAAHTPDHLFDDLGDPPKVLATLGI